MIGGKTGKSSGSRSRSGESPRGGGGGGQRCVWCVYVSGEK